MKKKVLVIDDSETNNFLVKAILEENKDILVFTLSNSKKAIKLIQEINPDLVILDIMMPDIDGIQILRELNQLKIIHKYNIIVVSAKNNASIKEEALTLGALDYIIKPIGNSNLFEKVENHLIKQTNKSKL